jgi:hypothetical protein
MNKGDINNDEILNINDTNILMDNIVNKITIDETEVEKADINEDNNINLVDVINLSRAIEGESISYINEDTIVIESINTNQTQSNTISIPGPAGKDGVNGINGTNGVDGKDAPTMDYILNELKNNEEFISLVSTEILKKINNQKISETQSNNELINYY